MSARPSWQSIRDLAGFRFDCGLQNFIFSSNRFVLAAEFFADIALCPFEAVKVRVQTQPGFAKGLLDGMPKFIAQEGVGG